MSEVCGKCGLPEDLCVCEDIAKEQQTITVTTEKRKFGKDYTVIEGLKESEIDMKDLAKKLKTQFACGGTVKEGKIELQRDHTKEIKSVLVEEGFPPESIQVK